MRHNLDLLLLLYWMFMTSHARSTLSPKFDIGICSTEPLACCTGYRKEDGECKECWPGTYGENCSINCPEGWYGLFCKEKCRCFPCNYVNGCSSDTNLREGETDFINWKTVVVSTFASFSVCVVVGIMCYKLRRGTPAISNSSEMKDIRESSNLHQNTRTQNKAHGGRVKASCADHTRQEFSSNKQKNTTAYSNTRETRMDSEPKQGSDSLLRTANNVYNHIDLDFGPYATLTNSRRNQAVPCIEDNLYDKHERF